MGEVASRAEIIPILRPRICTTGMSFAQTGRASPQWQIEAFRRLEMPDQLMKRFGWTPLTDDVKRRIFGLNAARVYRVDPEAKRNPMPSDYIEKLRRMYKQSGALTPSNTQYGWVPA